MLRGPRRRPSIRRRDRKDTPRPAVVATMPAAIRMTPKRWMWRSSHGWIRRCNPDRRGVSHQPHRPFREVLSLDVSIGVPLTSMKLISVRRNGPRPGSPKRRQLLRIAGFDPHLEGSLNLEIETRRSIHKALKSRGRSSGANGNVGIDPRFIFDAIWSHVLETANFDGPWQ